MAEEVRLTGWHAIRYAERHRDAVLCNYATPLEDAGEDIPLEAAREIAREDASLVYCDVPTEIVEAEMERVFGRRARVLAARRENTQVEVVVDGWMEPVWYAVGPLMSELAEWADGAGDGEGDPEVCRSLEECGAFLGFRSNAEARPTTTPA